MGSFYPCSLRFNPHAESPGDAERSLRAVRSEYEGRSPATKPPTHGGLSVCFRKSVTRRGAGIERLIEHEGRLVPKRISPYLCYMRPCHGCSHEHAAGSGDDMDVDTPVWQESGIALDPDTAVRHIKDGEVGP